MERRLCYKALEKSTGADDRLNRLSTGTRLWESTVGAIRNIAGGTWQLIFGKNRGQGALRIGEGVLDAVDIIPSAAADFSRATLGPTNQPRGKSPHHYHLSRAWDQVENAGSAREAVSGLIDTTHALTTKLFTDGIRGFRRNTATPAIAG